MISCRPADAAASIGKASSSASGRVSVHTVPRLRAVNSDDRLGGIDDGIARSAATLHDHGNGVTPVCLWVERSASAFLPFSSSDPAVDA